MRQGRITAILQMGKVGSTAIRRALEGVGIEGILNGHHLSRETLDRIERNYRDWDRPLPTSWQAGTEIRRRVIDAPAGKAEPIDIISIVRDPVARNLSGFTNAFHIPGREGLTDPAQVRIASERFMAEHKHEWPLNWFDEQLHATLGVDVYTRPFDHTGKNLHIGEASDAVRVLVLRLEDDDETKARALAQFLDLPEIPEIPRANDTGHKTHAEASRRIRDAMVFDEAFLDRMYDHKMVRHFYTDTERARMKQRWLANGRGRAHEQRVPA